MSSITTPPASPQKTNRLGLDFSLYRGSKTTLCAGCGHNAISERIIDAFFDLGIDPSRIAKFSGIGCSSKSPAYFLSRSFAINGVHGRMPSIATGSLLANRDLLALGVSGDGDTASIGIGQFVHMLRRNLPIIYIVEDNGVYGLTKGQFSATADAGSKSKSGVVNDLLAIDTCALAVELGATFVARSFSGDKRQLLAILKAAISHRGTAMIDVISPCVTFNDHEGSTKSYSYVKDHEEPLTDVSYVPYFENIEVEYDPGTTVEVRLHDGSFVRLKKLDPEYNPTSRLTALNLLREARQREEILTGIFYIETSAKDFVETLNLVDEPLASLSQECVRPAKEVLEEVMEELR
jgi:2-oxoglutarate/2-oxoacid ferredoxin oxidoreductase subunit beta